MSRFGWFFLGVLVLAIGGLLSVTSFGVTDGIGRWSSAVVGRLIPPRQPATDGLLRVPVAGVGRAQIEDNWGDARGDGTRAHHGTDIMAAGGTPVVAAAPGVVEKLFQSELGGITLYVRSANRRWTYYYAHLAGYAPGLHEGQVVRAGDPLGFVGDTGDAGPGNFHLHFGLERLTPEQRWWQGQEVNPYPLLAGRPSQR